MPLGKSTLYQRPLNQSLEECSAAVLQQYSLLCMNRQRSCHPHFLNSRDSPVLWGWWCDCYINEQVVRANSLSGWKQVGSVFRGKPDDFCSETALRRVLVPLLGSQLCHDNSNKAVISSFCILSLSWEWKNIVINLDRTRMVAFWVLYPHPLSVRYCSVSLWKLCLQGSICPDFGVCHS